MKILRQPYSLLRYEWVNHQIMNLVALRTLAVAKGLELDLKYPKFGKDSSGIVKFLPLWYNGKNIPMV